MKAALICESHEYPSIPIVHAYAKEDRRSVLRILELIKYKEKNWPIISDLKVINFLLGFPGGFAKIPQNGSKNPTNDVYNGPQIRKLLNDDNFSNSVTKLEQSAWKCFSNVCKNVLGNNVENEWSNIVDEYILSLIHI